MNVSSRPNLMAHCLIFWWLLAGATLRGGQNAQRILVLGDSITYAGHYVTLLQLATADADSTPPMIVNAGLPSETVSGLSEEGHADGKFPRPHLFERLDRILDLVQPDLVLACYGMNDGLYQPLAPARQKAFERGVDRLTRAVADRGARLIWITPPVFDGQVARRIEFNGDPDYDDVLTAYSRFLIDRFADDGVIDLHAAMRAELERHRSDPAFTFQRDAVHPGDEGHRLIASTVIDWFNRRDDQRWVLPSPSDARIPDAESSMRRLRDAALSTSGHRRPGLPTGPDYHAVLAGRPRD